MSTSQAPGIRARNRAALESELRDVGRRHLAEHGAAALSLRAVARDLGRTPSSLYRYVRDRDALLTVLIVDAYDNLGDALDAAVHGISSTREAFGAFAGALRTWALGHRSEYALLYGSPVPGYHAPAEDTARAGNRPLLLLAHLLAGIEPPPEIPGTSENRQREAAEALRPLVAEPELAEFGVDAPTLTRAVAVWNLLLGAITAEAFEQLVVLTEQPDDLWSGTVDLATALLFGPRSAS